MNTPILFQLQILGPWLNVIQVKCHTGSQAAFVHSTQNVLLGRSAARVRVRQDFVQVKRGKRGSFILPSSQGPDSETFRKKVKGAYKRDS